ncbi:MAG TPA: Ig-like domain-containing protein [Gemmatimonadales bacterium]|nr:Ig-like domain-containing protein [Gemmatimonadales bacterium]
MVPVLSVVGLGGDGGTVLFDDLDVLRVIVRTSTQAAVVDTSVPVDQAGDAMLTVPVLAAGSAQTYQVGLQGIRSRDGAVLYRGSDTVTVTPTRATRVDSVPVAYVGPCQLGAGCRVTLAPQDTTLAAGGSMVMRMSVDSAGVPVAGVPVALTNVTPTLILVAPDGRITALLTPTGGAGRVAAAIRGAADTLRLTVAALTAPAAVLITPGYATLTTVAPGNSAQLGAAVTDIAGKPLSPALATWTSRNPKVALVSNTGLLTAAGSGSGIVVATAAPGVADSVAVVVGDPRLPPGNAIALALTGGRSFGVGKVGQPVAIDIVVDLKAATAGLLASYDARFTWSTAALKFDSTEVGTIALLTVIPDTAAGGILHFSGSDPLGKGGSPTLARLWFTATGAGPSNHVLALNVLSAIGAVDLLPGLLVAPGNATIAP